MEKRLPTARIQDQVDPAGYCAKRAPCPPSVNNLYADPVPSKPRRRINYGFGKAPREEPVEIPRLFIRGLGGSVKMDLLGIGVKLSEESFMHFIADESLRDLHVHRGDLALIDPIRHTLDVGNLVLLELPGSGAIIRRLSKRNRVWYLSKADNGNPESFPLINQPMQGVVVGFLRLTTKIKPVNYRGAEANFALAKERAHATVPICKRAGEKPVESSPSKTRYRKNEHRPFLLTSESKPSYPSPKTRKKAPHSPKAKTC